MQANCSNCGAGLNGTYKFCPQCGQSTATHRLHWHDVQHDLTHYFTHADKGIFFLIKELALRTGNVAKEYIEGKRKKYMSPVTFYLLVAGIYVVAMHFLSSQFPGSANNETLTTGMNVQQARAIRANVFLEEHLKVLAFLALPVSAFVYWLFYKRKGFSYLEQLVANMYANGFTLLVMCLLIQPVAAFITKDNNSIYGASTGLLFQLAYLFVFYYRFAGGGNTKAKLRAFIAVVVALFSWLAFVFLMISLYVNTGFFGLLK